MDQALLEAPGGFCTPYSAFSQPRGSPRVPRPPQTASPLAPRLMVGSTVVPHLWGRNLSIGLASSLPVALHGLLGPRFCAFSRLGSLQPGDLSLVHSVAPTLARVFLSPIQIMASVVPISNPTPALDPAVWLPAQTPAMAPWCPGKKAPARQLSIQNPHRSHLPPLPHPLPTVPDTLPPPHLCLRGPFCQKRPACPACHLFVVKVLASC